MAIKVNSAHKPLKSPPHCGGR